MRIPPALLLALVIPLAAPACADDGGPRFDDQGGLPINCMQHQPEPPGTRYTDPSRQRTDEAFAVLRYYTAHGLKPYCDGDEPTETDREWATYYVDQGADPSNVAPLLPPPDPAR